MIYQDKNIILYWRKNILFVKRMSEYIREKLYCAEFLENTLDPSNCLGIGIAAEKVTAVTN